MFTNVKFYLTVLFGLFFIQWNVYAQEPDWGTDPGKAKEQWALMTDYVKAQKYEEGKPALDWLLENTPKHSKNLYIWAIETYEALEKKSAGTPENQALQDKVLSLYDKRFEMGFYDDEVEYLSRLGYRAYPYLVTRPGSLGTLDSLYTKLMDKQGNSMNRSHLTYFSDVLRRRAVAKEIGQDRLMQMYDKIGAIVKHNIKNSDAAESKKWEDSKSKIIEILETVIEIDCKFILENWGPKFKENPEDMEITKKIVVFMQKNKCTSEPLFFEALKAVYAQEPDFAMAKNIANFYLSKEDTENALKYLEEAVKIATTDEDKADMYMRSAKIYQSKGRKSDARSYAMKAAAASSSMAKDAYEMIGDLYYYSSECKEGKDAVKSRANYLIAYEMYEKAGSSSKMARAKEQFPTMEVIFTLNYKEGDSIEVGCWIGGNTTIRKQ